MQQQQQMAAHAAAAGLPPGSLQAGFGAPPGLQQFAAMAAAHGMPPTSMGMMNPLAGMGFAPQLAGQLASMAAAKQDAELKQQAAHDAAETNGERMPVRWLLLVLLILLTKTYTLFCFSS